jgi:hypothetical protein
MAEAATTEKKNQSWRKLGWGLVLFLMLPALPFMNVLFPIQETWLLLIPAVAACSMVGWREGARAALAIVWLVLAAWILIQPTGAAGTPYDQMARGWAILLAASFGAVSLWSAATGFFVRALSAVTLAVGAAFVIALAAPSGMARFEHAAGDEFTRRTTGMIETLEENRRSPAWKDMSDRVPQLDEMNEESEAAMRSLPDAAAGLLPALLALESLAALGLAWGLYQRLSAVKIGPALGPLTEFRFSDQLIWGLAVGLTLCLLPAFVEARGVGFNLLLFFGALYLVRGLGVLAWIAKGRYLFMILLGLIPQGLALLGVVALAFGLGDTWLDLRRRRQT